MFKIQDGRDKFYQWDLNRKLIVEDSSITQVHFSNAIYTTALVCEVIDGIVNVPNIILQDELDINVYGYDRDYTKHSATFNVVKRTKPESYVYTETEILNYNVLLDKINAIDLTNYYTIPESNEKFATKEEIPSTTGFATESYVDNAVANVKIDLTGYATENYVDNKVAAIPKPDLSGYALKSEIPDTSGFITEIPAEYVTETELESKGYLTEHQSLEGYATEEYVDNAIANIPPSGGQTTSTPNLKGNKESNYLLMDSNSRADISNQQCVALGSGNTVGAQGAIALGRQNTQYSSYATQFTIGDNNKTNCWGNYAFGRNNTVGLGAFNNRKGDTMALGYQLKCASPYSVVIGYNNIADYDSKYALIVGNGQSSVANGFTLDWSGNGAFGGQVGSTGSDYAEYFEWADGNPEAEDRVGYLVALDGDKIRLATPDDEILGIVSGTVAVLGDNYEWQWQGKYLTDDYGRVIYDMVDKYEEYEGEQVYMGTFPEPRINPDWDETATYISRAKRKEWDAVGLLGKLYVRDDGTCKPNDYIKVGADGIATVSAEKTNIRVMSRKTDNIIRVYIK